MDLEQKLILMGISMLGNSRMQIGMVKVHTLMEKGNGKEASILENGRMAKNMVKQQKLPLMETSMLGNTRMGFGMVGNNMVKGQIFPLMASMLGNTRMGFGMVKVHTLGLMGIKG